jgi:hypothetical protein
MRKVSLVAACTLALAVVLLNTSRHDVFAQTPPTLPVAPTTWTLTNASQTTDTVTLTSVSAPPLATGQHVATCVIAAQVLYTNIYVWGSNPSLPELLVLRDGPSGTGKILMQWVIPPLIYPSNMGSQVEICGLNVVGSKNRRMTLEYTWAADGGTSSTNAPFQSVTLVGYDAL